MLELTKMACNFLFQVWTKWMHLWRRSYSFRPCIEVPYFPSDRWHQRDEVTGWSQHPMNAKTRSLVLVAVTVGVEFVMLVTIIWQESVVTCKSVLMTEWNYHSSFCAVTLWYYNFMTECQLHDWMPGDWREHRSVWWCHTKDQEYASIEWDVGHIYKHRTQLAAQEVGLII